MHTQLLFSPKNILILFKNALLGYRTDQIQEFLQALVFLQLALTKSLHTGCQVAC